MVTKISIDTEDSIRFFKRRFRSFGYGDGHYILACHAAFPIALTPDLLYQLWANFRTYTDRRGQIQSINELSVSDLLLSNLCREVSREIFEINVEVRAFLLEKLKEDERFGEERMRQLGNFLYQYIQEVGITIHPKSFIDAQLWTALATIAPKQAANEITQSLTKAIQEKDHQEIFRIRNLLENYSNQEGAFENLLHYSKGIKAAILNYDMSVVQQQMDYSGAKILTIEEGGVAADTIVEIPLLEDLEDKVALEEEKVNTTGEQKALHRIKQEADLKTGKLDLSGLRLKNIPDEVFILSHLTALDLFDNQLTSLSIQIQQLKNLEKLLVSKNPIKQLPSALQNLKALKTFKLDDGKLTDFPTELLKMDSLENISLEKNKIEFIPPTVADLPNLKLYDFRDNPVLNIPEGLFKRTGQTIRDYFASFTVKTSNTPVVLILSADPENKINEEAEIRAINTLLGEQVKMQQLQVIVKENVTLLELFQVCQQYQKQIKILHFAFYHLQLPNENGKLIDVSPRLLNKFLGNLSNCELVVFNVCDAAELAELASKDIKTASIGIDGKITDTQAIEFSQELYENLLGGTSIKDTCEKLAPKYLKEDLRQRNIQQSANYSNSGFDQPQASLIKLYPDDSLAELKRTVKDQVATDSLSAVFKLLQEAIDDDSSERDTLVLLQSRFVSEESTYRQSLINDETYQITKNQLRAAILDLIEGLQVNDLVATQMLNRIPFPKEVFDLYDRITKSSQPMTVLLKGNQKAIENFKSKYIDSPFLQFTETEDDNIAYALVVKDAALEIQDLKTGQLIHGINEVFDAAVEYIKTKLEAIEKWHRIADLKNDSTLDENEIEFIFSKEENAKEFTEYKENEIELTYPKKGEDKTGDGDPKAIWYAIKAKNNASQTHYVSLLYLSNDFGIKEHFPCQEIPAQSDYKILDDQHGLIISNPNEDYSIDHFLLIVSTVQFDVSRFVEDEIEVGKTILFNQANRKIQTRGSNYSIRESKENQEWFTKKISVTLTREGSERKDTDKKAKRIYISSTHQDNDSKERLKEMMLLLEKSGEVEILNATDKVKVGDNWNNVLNDLMVSADMICLLISRNYIVSEFAWSLEMPKALELQKNNQVVLVPILLNNIANYKELPVAKFQTLPKDGKSIASWENEEDAWVEIAKELTKIIKRDTSKKEEKKLPLLTYHSLTCNRTGQIDAFHNYLNNKKEDKLYFNLIYGEDLNAPESLFKRLVMELDGRATDYLNPEVEVLEISSQILNLEISKNLEIAKQNLIKNLLAIYGLSLDTAIHELNLGFILRQSPKIGEIACLYIEISEYDWDIKITPHLINWFINDFCHLEKDSGAIKFYCFFSFILEEANSPIEKEIVNTFQRHQQINVLPKLEKVSRRDIQKWLSRYRHLLESTRQRKEYLKQYFGDDDEYYMEDVEIELKKIIDEYNVK